MSQVPTVTLANHTTIITGAHPGHHGILHNGILHNGWYDREAGEQVITNSSATGPGAFSASINEPCDTGVDYSTFVLVADHGMEQNDPTCRGDWDVALRAAGIRVRDEAYGFLYFGVPSAYRCGFRTPGGKQCAGS